MMATILACGLLWFLVPVLEEHGVWHDQERLHAGFRATGLESPPDDASVQALLDGRSCSLLERTQSSLYVVCVFDQPAAHSGRMIDRDETWAFADALRERFPAHRYSLGIRLRVESIGALPWLPWLRHSDATKLLGAVLILAMIHAAGRWRRRRHVRLDTPPLDVDASSRRAVRFAAVALLLVGLGTAALGTAHGAAAIAPLVGLALVTPLWEEVLYRELLLRFQPDLWTRVIAVWAGAITFAFAHGVPSRTPELFVFGVLTGYAWCRTRSVWPPVALHAAWNFVVSTT